MNQNQDFNVEGRSKQFAHAEHGRQAELNQKNDDLKNFGTEKDNQKLQIQDFIFPEDARLESLNFPN